MSLEQPTQGCTICRVNLSLECKASVAVWEPEFLAAGPSGSLQAAESARVWQRSFLSPGVELEGAGPFTRAIQPGRAV